MDKILEALYKGKIRPYENLAPTDPEFHTLKEQYLNEMEYFKSILKAEDYERLNNLEEISDTLTEMEHVEAFSRGFRLAAKLVGEAYYNKDELPDFFN